MCQQLDRRHYYVEVASMLGVPQGLTIVAFDRTATASLHDWLT